MKSRLFIVLSLLLISSVYLTIAAQEDRDKTIIGRLYFENKFDSIFVVLPEFVETTEVGSPEWEEMEKWTPHAAIGLARFSKDKAEKHKWASRADSLWGAVDKRRGLKTGEKYARIEVWKFMRQWQRIVDFVKSDKTVQEKNFIVEEYFEARLKAGDTLNFVEDLNTSTIRYSTMKEPYLFEYYEMSGNWEAAIAGYEEKLASGPDPGWSNYEIYWSKKLAEVFMKLDRWNEALERINFAIEKNESNNFPFYDETLFAIRGKIYYHLGRFEEARADSTRYLNYKNAIDDAEGTVFW